MKALESTNANRNSYLLDTALVSELKSVIRFPRGTGASLLASIFLEGEISDLTDVNVSGDIERMGDTTRSSVRIGLERRF